MKRYSLEELAHFDRCLFPYDFRRDLISEGINGDKAEIISNFIKDKGTLCGIIHIYQVHARRDEELLNAIENILERFVEKYWRSKKS